MKPQRPQRNTLCTPKEFPLKDITVSHRLRIISSAIEAHLTFLRAANKRIGLLINFNVELLKKGIKRLII